MSSTDDLPSRITRLEQSARRAWIAALLPWSLVVVCAVRAPGGAADDSVLRARGLVIEDAAGHPRILLGAPVPKVDGRTRADAPSGIVYLAADGTDRIQIGDVGGPQMGGKVQKRIADATGMMVNDERGDERGGFGIMANGRIALGLDDAHGEGVMLIVAPDLKLNGLVVNEKGERRLDLVVEDGRPRIVVHGADGKEHDVPLDAK